MNWIVVSEDGTLRVPTDVFVSWQQPLSIVAQHDGEVFTVRVDLPHSWSLWPPRIGRGMTELRFARTDQEAGVAIFKNPKEFVPTGTYAVANYHPMYALIPHRKVAGNVPSQETEVKVANAAFWGQVVDYHEHRRLDSQDRESHLVSRMLVDEVEKRSEKPDSILELGCGAGRNLLYFGNSFPDAEVLGVDINAAATSSAGLPDNVSLEQGDVLGLDWDALGRFDVIFTAGFLMHVNHESVKGLLAAISSNCDLHMHFELHGPKNRWDFHRYPRSYAELFDEAGVAYSSYRIFARDNEAFSYGLTSSFAHALIVS